MARWDWYQATVHEASASAVCRHLEKSFPGSVTTPGYAKNGYLHGAVIVLDEKPICEIWWEGNPGVQVKASGENSPGVCQALREGHFKHRVSRADACEDWKEKGLFDRLADHLRSYAIKHNIKLNQQGDWTRGESRTLYLGSRKSVAQLVLYEKGYQTGTDPTWVRLEARIFPKGDKGYDVSQWLPADAFGGTRWMTNLLHELGWDHLQKRSIGTVRKPTDAEKIRTAMFNQYGPALVHLIHDLGGPDAPMHEILKLYDQHQEETQALKKMVEDMHR